VNRSCWQLTMFFTNFLSKFEMPIYMKVVSPDEDRVWFEDRWMVASWCDE
jgi:hypothetical protein